MTQEEILEYNKRCAEFLEWVKYNGTNPAWNDSYDTNKIHFGEKTVHLRYMKFHSDWNWIMEVVEVINSTGRFEVIIQYGFCYITDGEDELTLSCPNKTTTAAVVQAINQFLIWYNENKTN